MSFFTELKRRNVFRVAFLYVVTGWILMQAGDVMFPALALPEWSIRLLAALLVLGFPLALIFSWVFELTPDGLRRESSIEPDSAAPAHAARRMDRLTVALLLVLIVVVVLGQLRGDRDEERPAPAVAAPSAVLETDPPAQEHPAPTSTAQPSVNGSAVSIAVLPFVNMSGNEDNEYFSDGLTETLLHNLARVPDMRVAARTSSFKFKNMAEDVSLIGRQLRVDNVLEGSVQRSGDRVRITAQLIKVDGGFHLWSETYDRTLNDIFEVQDEIAENVLGALKVTLLGEAPSTRNIDVAVFDRYLKANALAVTRDAVKIDQAIELLESVVEQAPVFAPAYASLADAYLAKQGADALSPDALVPQAEAMARRAIDLDPADADGLLAMARVKMAQDLATEADALLEKAVDLEPHNARVLGTYSRNLRLMNRFEEALAAGQQAMLLDPLNAELKKDLAVVYLFTGREDEGIDMIRASLEISPQDLALLDALADLYSMSGRLVEAIPVRQDLIALNPRNVGDHLQLINIYLNLDLVDRAEQVVEDVREIAPDRVTGFEAQICLYRGDADCLRDRLASLAEIVPERIRYEILAELAYVEGRLAEAAEYLEMDLKLSDERGNPRVATRSAELAAIYHLLGDLTARDRALARARQVVDMAREGGIRWAFLTHVVPALMAAAQGHAADARALLMQARETGVGFAGPMRWYWLAFEPIRGSQEVEELQALSRRDAKAAIQKLSETDPD